MKFYRGTKGVNLEFKVYDGTNEVDLTDATVKVFFRNINGESEFEAEVKNDNKTCVLYIEESNFIITGRYSVRIEVHYDNGSQFFSDSKNLTVMDPGTTMY